MKGQMFIKLLSSHCGLAVYNNYINFDMHLIFRGTLLLLCLNCEQVSKSEK